MIGVVNGNRSRRRFARSSGSTFGPQRSRDCPGERFQERDAVADRVSSLEEVPV